MFMRRNCVSFGLLICLGIFIACFLSSCISNKKIVYFNNLPDSAKIQLDKLQPPETIVQINDVLEISVGGENEKTVQYIQQYFSGGEIIRAMVDADGNAELPKVGKIHVLGLTNESLKDTITNRYKEYLVDPIVQVKFGNFRFTILGEVRSPGNYDMTSDNVNIFEALGKAGDLTEYAQRDHIKIIRNINGNREVVALDLNDKSILNSPYYYINRYDIIYVEPKNLKLTTNNIQRVTTYFGILTSLLAIFIVLFRN
jgi:polysaccharide export outer membrane protein